MNLTNEERNDQDCALIARGLVRRFGTTVAVRGLDLSIPRGVVCGLIGDNGAGKSTTLRMALGLLPPTSGTLEVLGMDPARQGPALRARIGYVPEDRRLYRYMKVRGILRYARALHPGWDPELECQLVERFELWPDQRIGTLSRGTLAKLYLVLALGHRPELLVLDEATGGIDALARRDILGMLVETVADTGLTILFASHVLQDVERIAEQVAILHDGRLLAHRSLDELRTSVRQIQVRFAGEAPEPPADLPGLRRIEKRRSEWLLLSDDAAATEAALRAQLASLADAPEIEQVPLSLEDLFVGLLELEAAA